MNFINLKTSHSREEVLSVLKNNELVNRGVRFDPQKGVPKMKVKDKENSVRITCEMTMRPTRDNGFLIGTFFIGKIRSSDSGTTLKGMILTAPLYHLILFGLFAFSIYQCFKAGGISVMPIFLILFNVLLFKEEYKKQGYIKSYLYRAFRRL